MKLTAIAPTCWTATTTLSAVGGCSSTPKTRSAGFFIGRPQNDWVQCHRPASDAQPPQRSSVDGDPLYCPRAGCSCKTEFQRLYPAELPIVSTDIRSNQ